MRKMFLIALTCASTIAFGQGKTLYSVLVVKPKAGQTAAFETSWKAHVAKFHNTTDKRSVTEILTGQFARSYQIIEGPKSYADMDIEKPTDAAHEMDFENNVAPKLESTLGEFIYRWADTLSYNGDQQADKFLNTVYNVKSGKMADFNAEIKRGMVVNTKIKSPSSYNTYIRLFSGSSPQVAVISNLTEGFKQLDSEFRPGMNTTFKEAYLKEYSQELWDKRISLLQELLVGYELQLTKHRKDLSSKQ